MHQRTRVARALVFGAVASLGRIVLADPTFITGTRTALPGEGYLQYQQIPDIPGTFGEEWTGWVDVRHPANDGTTSAVVPFDRSNRKIDVKTITAIANDGSSTSASPQNQRDFEFTNKIYAQSGISVLQESRDSVKLDGTGGSVNLPAWPINQLAQDDNLKSLKRSANAPTINAYYVKQYDDTNPNGLTSPPAGYGGNVPRNDGSGIADQAVSSTFAHELGHMLLNGPALFDQDAVPSESNNTTNWMYKTGSSFNLKDVSWTKGRIEPVQATRLFQNGGTFNPGFVQNNSLLSHHKYGDKVDWDFVTDHSALESVGNGGDNHPGVDSLYFGLTGGTPTGGPETDHDHTGLDAFAALDFYSGPTFRYADIFSLSLQFSDFDLNGSGELGLREGALDYQVVFRASDGSTANGIADTEFAFGWTISTSADNYLTRWYSPIDATGVFIYALNGGLHDGTTQIDAVIVSSVPEPASVFLLAPAMLLLRRRSLAR